LARIECVFESNDCSNVYPTGPTKATGHVTAFRTRV
jgi:hypothetical protein